METQFAMPAGAYGTYPLANHGDTSQLIMAGGHIIYDQLGTMQGMQPGGMLMPDYQAAYGGSDAYMQDGGQDDSPDTDEDGQNLQGNLNYKSKPRRKATQKPVGSDQKRQAFSKRKRGIVLKAYQLYKLTDAKVFMFMVNDKGSSWSYASPGFGASLHPSELRRLRELAGLPNSAKHSTEVMAHPRVDEQDRAIDDRHLYVGAVDTMPRVPHENRPRPIPIMGQHGQIMVNGDRERERDGMQRDKDQDRPPGMQRMRPPNMMTGPMPGMIMAANGTLIGPPMGMTMMPPDMRQGSLPQPQFGTQGMQLNGLPGAQQLPQPNTQGSQELQQDLQASRLAVATARYSQADQADEGSPDAGKNNTAMNSNNSDTIITPTGHSLAATVGLSLPLLAQGGGGITENRCPSGEVMEPHVGQGNSCSVSTDQPAQSAAFSQQHTVQNQKVVGQIFTDANGNVFRVVQECPAAASAPSQDAAPKMLAASHQAGSNSNTSLQTHSSMSAPAAPISLSQPPPLTVVHQAGSGEEQQGNSGLAALAAAAAAAGPGGSGGGQSTQAQPGMGGAGNAAAFARRLGLPPGVQLPPGMVFKQDPEQLSSHGSGGTGFMQAGQLLQFQQALKADGGDAASGMGMGLLGQSGPGQGQGQRGMPAPFNLALAASQQQQQQHGGRGMHSQGNGGQVLNLQHSSGMAGKQQSSGLQAMGSGMGAEGWMSAELQGYHGLPPGTMMLVSGGNWGNEALAVSAGQEQWRS